MLKVIFARCICICGLDAVQLVNIYCIRGYFRWVDIFVGSTDTQIFQPLKFLVVRILINTWS